MAWLCHTHERAPRNLSRNASPNDWMKDVDAFVNHRSDQQIRAAAGVR
jgi:hypothetical protein